MFVIVSVLRTPDFDSGFIIFGFDYSTMDFYIKKKGRGTACALAVGSAPTLSGILIYAIICLFPIK